MCTRRRRIPLNECIKANGVELIHFHSLQDGLGHVHPCTTHSYDRARNNLTESANYDVARAFA